MNDYFQLFKIFILILSLKIYLHNKIKYIKYNFICLINKIDLICIILFLIPSKHFNIEIK